MSVPSWETLIANLRILEIDRKYDTLGRIKRPKRLRSNVNFKKELGYGKSKSNDDGAGRKVPRRGG